MVCADDLPAGSRARREAAVLAGAGHLVTLHGVLSDGAEPEEDDGNVVLVRVPLDRWKGPHPGLRGTLSASAYFERMAPVVRVAVTRTPPEVLHVVGVDAAAPAMDAARDHALPLVFDDAQAADPGADDAAGGGRLRETLRKLRERGQGIEKKVRARAVACVATSEALADDAQARFGGERPIVVRDCPPLRPVVRSDALRVKLGIHPADRVVVFHGPPDAAHGVETAIRALRVLGERVVLVILGAAWCQDRLLRLATELDVLPQVRVASVGIGAGLDETLRLVASAEVAVLPLSPAHRETRLGLPAALFETLMAGTPLVVPDVDEAGVLVRRIRAGIVVPCGRDVHANDVADGIRTLLSDPDLRSACASAARHAAETELHWLKETERLIDLYDRLGAGPA